MRSSTKNCFLLYAGTVVNASLLGTTTRTGGTTQVTYNGWLLYHFASDKAAGETKGEGIQNVWYVVTPEGMQNNI
jgi:predicted lipoprotein with Yx(FWY)xxD motif